MAKRLFVDAAGKPRLRRSFCAFLDILGFRSRIRAAENSPANLRALLRRYLAGVSPPTDALIDEATDIGSWEVAAFSDAIMLGHPLTTPDGEAEFGDLQDELCKYQLALALEGLFVRGAVAVGDLFMDDRLAFGPAVIDAYELQESEALQPRVIFSAPMVKLLKSHLKFYGRPAQAPHNEDLVVDADGQVFLNYLSQTFIDCELDEETLVKHKEVVEACLRQYGQQPRIRSKYQWVAEYHNYFVSLLPEELLSASLRIGSKALVHSFSRFVSVRRR